MIFLNQNLERLRTHSIGLFLTHGPTNTAVTTSPPSFRTSLQPLQRFSISTHLSILSIPPSLLKRVFITLPFYPPSQRSYICDIICGNHRFTIIKSRLKYVYSRLSPTRSMNTSIHPQRQVVSHSTTTRYRILRTEIKRTFSPSSSVTTTLTTNHI